MTAVRKAALLAEQMVEKMAARWAERLVGKSAG